MTCQYRMWNLRTRVRQITHPRVMAVLWLSERRAARRMRRQYGRYGNAIRLAFMDTYTRDLMRSIRRNDGWWRQ